MDRISTFLFAKIDAVIPVLASAASVYALFVAASPAWAAGDATAGQQVFARCAACHDSGIADSRIPKREQIAARSPEAITSAMFDGAMIGQASGLTLEEGRAIARFVTLQALPC